MNFLHLELKDGRKIEFARKNELELLEYKTRHKKMSKVASLLSWERVNWTQNNDIFGIKGRNEMEKNAGSPKGKKEKDKYAAKLAIWETVWYQYILAEFYV
jgi:hypothetical protein